jgi:hypothetical protein
MDPVAARFSELPTFATGTEAPPNNELIFVQINLLKIVSVERSFEGGCVVVWQSIDGISNKVESSDDGGSAWRVIHAVEGNGAPMSFTDADSGLEKKIYRIRIDYE